MVKLADEMKMISKEFADDSITEVYYGLIEKIREVASTTGKRYLITPDIINYFEWEKLVYRDGFTIIRLTGGEVIQGETVERGDLMIKW